MSVEKLRSLTLGAPAKGRTKLVTITLGDQSSEVEVRAPSLRQQDLCARQATDKDDRLNAQKQLALFVIACTWDPEEDKQVFSGKDLDTILSFGTTGWVGQIAEALKAIVVEQKELDASFG